MNGAFVARVCGPSLPQARYLRALNVRCIATNARRTSKNFEQPGEEALLAAADVVPTSAKRTRKQHTVAVEEEAVAEPPETEVSAPAKGSRRRRAVDDDGTSKAGDVLVEAKSRRSSRKKTTEATLETNDIITMPAEVTTTAVVEGSAKPKRISRKKTNVEASDTLDTVGEDVSAAAADKPKAKRLTKKLKEANTPDVVSTRSRRKPATDPDDETPTVPAVEVEEESVPPTAATVAAKRRAASRRGGSGRTTARAPTAANSMQSELSNLVIQRNESGEVVSINRAAVGMGRKMWYAIGVTGGMERKWAEQLRQKLASSDSTMEDPETGELVPISALIVPWVPVRRDWVMAKKTGNVIQRDVVYKEGWVYINAPLDEQVVRLIEESYGFQQWRGEQDHFLDDVGAVKLITPLSEEAIEEIRAWEAAPVEEQMDEATREALSRQMFGEAGGDVLGRSERLEEREGATELDVNGRVVYRNPDYTGGRNNPSNWYSESDSTADAAAEPDAEMLSLDGRGNELAYAPEPERKNRRQAGPWEPRDGARDRRQGYQGQGLGASQDSRKGSGRGWEKDTGRGRSSPTSPPVRQQAWERQDEPPSVPSRAGVRPSAARSTPPQSPSLASKASDYVLRFDDETNDASASSSPARRSTAGGTAAAAAAVAAPGSGGREVPAASRFEDTRGDSSAAFGDQDDPYDLDEGIDAVGRIDGPSGGLDMDDWFDSNRAAGGGSVAATAGTTEQRQPKTDGMRLGGAKAGGQAGGTYGKQPEVPKGKGGFDEVAGIDPAGNEFERPDGGYIDDDKGWKENFADFDFDLMDDDDAEFGSGSTRRGVGVGSAGGRDSRRRPQQTSGRSRGSAIGRGAGAAPLDDDFFGGLSFDYMNFDDEDDALASSSRGSGGGGGGGGGGYLGDFGDLDDDMWADFGPGERRSGAAARGGGSYGAAAGSKLGKGSGLGPDDDLFGGGNDDWGYLNPEDGGGFGDFGGADPFDLDADPWSGGGGFGRQSRSGVGGRSGEYRSGTRSGGGGNGGGGYMSGSGPNYDDDLGDPVSPTADKPRQGQGQGQGYRNGGGGGSWRQGSGRSNNWQQGGSGYSDRNYQNDSGRGYKSGGGGARGGGRGDAGGRRDNRSSSGYGQQRNRYSGGEGGRGGNMQDRRSGGQDGAQGAPSTP